MTKSRNILPPRQLWSEQDISLLRKAYPDTPSEAVAAALGRNIKAIYHKANTLGLKKSAAYLASPAACRLRRGDNIGAAQRFQQGNVPWNTGLKGYQPGGRSAETRFQPGQRQGKATQLYQPVGSERISKDGYLERKINDAMPFYKRWRAVHLILWESVNGNLPHGHALVFRDGDKRHVALQNLELVTRRELMRRNSVHNLPKQLAQLVQLRGALIRKINRFAREKQEPTK